MTYQASAARGDAARNIALVNYGLLFASVFFAGVPALVAVIIAYAQRDAASPTIRSHHNFQIRIFWIGFALTLVAGACGLAAAVNGVGALLEFTRENGWDGLRNVEIDLSRLSIDGVIVGLVVAAVVFSFLSMLWLIAAPAFGFIRLASERGIGKTPAP